MTHPPFIKFGKDVIDKVIEVPISPEDRHSSELAKALGSSDTVYVPWLNMAGSDFKGQFALRQSCQLNSNT